MLSLYSHEFKYTPCCTPKNWTSVCFSLFEKIAFLSFRDIKKMNETLASSQNDMTQELGLTIIKHLKNNNF